MAKKTFRSVHVWLSRYCRSRVALCALALLFCFTNNVLAQGSPLGGGGGLAASGEDAAQKLLQEKGGKNTFRVDPQGGSGGVSSEREVLENMKKLFKKIYLDPQQQPQASNPELDKWFSPHLRDINIDMDGRIEEVRGLAGRAKAGGILRPLCYASCPGCRWPDEHRHPECCIESTGIYGALITDTNFKACCVRKDDEKHSRELIACKYPEGDGWAGLFEYYFPTNAIGWESQRGTTMIATSTQVKQCIEASKKMMENSDWVTNAIQKGAEGGGDGLAGKVQDSIQGIRQNQKDPSLSFTDSLQGGGLTMRVNFAHMDPKERSALAKYFCMHEKQFMKLMDPEEDEKQLETDLYNRAIKKQIGTLRALRRIPIWANYCPQAVNLMTKMENTYLIDNTDGTPTDFRKGMLAYEEDPLYCQQMNVRANPIGGEFLKEGVLKSQGGGTYSEQSVGYTCRTGSLREGGFSARMVPVTLHSTAKIDPRTLDHAIPFLHAAGYYTGGDPPGMSKDLKSLYKRFEPKEYSKSLNMFSGQPWKGGVEGRNELGDRCLSYQGADYKGQNQPDQLFLTDVNHKPFTQEQVQEFKKYDREWADKQPEAFHNRNFNESVLNYGAAFRIFATCPAGYVRWRGPHSEEYAGVCGKENFGGK